MIQDLTSRDVKEKTNGIKYRILYHEILSESTSIIEDKEIIKKLLGYPYKTLSEETPLPEELSPESKKVAQFKLYKYSRHFH